MTTSPTQPSKPFIRQYRLLPDALPAAEQRIRKTTLIPQMSIIALVIVVSALLAGHNAPDTKTVLIFAIFAALFLTYVAFVSPKRMHRRLLKGWSTYLLEIGPDYLLRRQADTPDVRLSFSEVHRIERRAGYALRVIGASKLREIGIPEGIEHFDEVLHTVAALAPVAASPGDRALRTNVLMATGLVVYMVMLWATSPWIVLPLAAAVSTLLIWLIVFMQRSPNVTLRAKRNGWLYLIGVFTCGLKVLATIGIWPAR